MRFAFLIEPPFNFRDPDGSIRGCDVDLARHVCAALGADRFDPVETEFAALLPGLARGDWRMTTGLFATEERRETASFTRPIWALPDGLLVPRGNPLGLTGYRSVAERAACTLAVVQDQVQHRSALAFGIPPERILIFKTYATAADAVAAGRAGAYASVARAHSGFLELHPGTALDVVTVSPAEKKPAFGSYAVAKSDRAFLATIDRVLESYIGSAAHRAMMAGYGFSDADIDLLIG